MSTKGVGKVISNMKSQLVYKSMPINPLEKVSTLLLGNKSATPQYFPAKEYH